MAWAWPPWPSYFGPVIVMALSPLVFREKLVATKVAGILAAFCGMVLVDWNALADSGLSWGLVCGFMAAVMYAVMILCNKKARGITGLENTLWQLAAALVVVTVFMALREGGNLLPSVPGDSILPILLLGVVNTGVGCYLYFSGVGKLPAQSVAICGYLEPLSTLVFSALCLQEQSDSNPGGGGGADSGRRGLWRVLGAQKAGDPVSVLSVPYLLSPGGNAIIQRTIFDLSRKQRKGNPWTRKQGTESEPTGEPGGGRTAPPSGGPGGRRPGPV